jgi:asparagine synthase (glutamine-hydrolysing)
MCGICGYVGSSDEQGILTMTGTLAHRGPDGGGARCFGAANGVPPAALGHRRLSIIDPSPRGAQPMSYGDGRYWTTYNGELYNYRALRKRLEADGFKFASDCDTEVLLAMYARHGRDLLEHLNGMFAFAIWDAEGGELFLARDRLGIKPLYHCLRDGVLYFASEVKSLLSVLGRPRIRHDALADYLTFLWTPDPGTIFQGVYKLPPGHCATFADGRLTVRQYWDMSFAPEVRPEEEWSSLLGEAVSSAVDRQMIADVPLGSFLSGGIDSSAIVAEMSKRQEQVTTYTIGFSGADLGHEIVPDDVRYAREVANRFEVDYNERILEADVVDLLPRLVWHMDEPVADPAAISTYLLCSAARERLTVILSGMGGDEIFAGYPRHLAARLARLLDPAPASARAAMRLGLAGRLSMGRPGRLRGPRRNTMKLMRGIDLPADERYLTYCSYYRPEELSCLLAPDLRGMLAEHDPFRAHREYLHRVEGEHWLNRLLYVDLKTFLPCLNLTYTDKMSMAASTEVRVPLLDDELVSLSGRIPPELKLKRFRRKYLFKRSMEGLLEKEIIWRPKAGFGAPLRAWLVGDLKPMVDDILSPSHISSRGLFDPSEVERIIRTNEAGAEDNALRLWALLTFEVWQETFLRDSAELGPPPGGIDLQRDERDEDVRQRT